MEPESGWIGRPRVRVEGGAGESKIGGGKNFRERERERERDT
jgi:hypothetical protein